MLEDRELAKEWPALVTAASVYHQEGADPEAARMLRAWTAYTRSGALELWGDAMSEAARVAVMVGAVDLAHQLLERATVPLPLVANAASSIAGLLAEESGELQEAILCSLLAISHQSGLKCQSLNLILQNSRSGTGF